MYDIHYPIQWPIHNPRHIISKAVNFCRSHPFPQTFKWWKWFWIYKIFIFLTWFINLHSHILQFHAGEAERRIEEVYGVIPWQTLYTIKYTHNIAPLPRCPVPAQAHHPHPQSQSQIYSETKRPSKDLIFPWSASFSPSPSLPLALRIIHHIPFVPFRTRTEIYLLFNIKYTPPL